jgi:hypothetical protein
MKRLTLLSALALIAFTRPAGAAENVVLSVNATDDPSAADNWSPADVGWYYTPRVTETVTDIGTKFGSSGFTPVTVQILASVPNTGGPDILDTGTNLIPVADTFAFATLNAPITLEAGTSYFIAFEGVAGLGVDVTNEAGATSLGSLHFDMVGDDSYSLVDANSTDINSQPILEFANNSGPAVPEPSTWALLFASVAGLIFIRRLRAPQA